MFRYNLEVEKFRKYLYGVEFLLETDHKPLSYMQTAKVLSPRIMRWAMKLQPHRCRIVLSVAEIIWEQTTLVDRI